MDNGEIAFDYGIRIFIVNGKYKDEESKEFSEVIEDLQKRNSEDIKNPIIKDIHDKTKKTEKGQTMLSEFIEERYGTVIRNYEEQHKRDQEQIQKIQNQFLKDKELHQEQHLRDQEEIQRYKKMLLDNGIKVD